jgi:hypothetical protein
MFVTPLEGGLPAVQLQAALLLGGPVAFHTVLGEQRLNVSDEVDGLVGRCGQPGKIHRGARRQGQQTEGCRGKLRPPSAPNG